MKRIVLQTLVVDDNDLECKKSKEEMTVEDIKLESLGFILSDLDKYDLIVYKGRLGKKVLRIQGV